MSAIWSNRKFKGMEVILGAINTPPMVPEFVRRFDLQYTVGAANEVQARSFMNISTMMRATVPWLTIIDRKGIIRARHFGDEPFMHETQQMANISKLVDQLLAETAAPATKKSAAPVKKKS